MQIGLMGLLKFALICFDFLAWPVIALGYPLFASIRAIETGSKYQMRKLVIYWTLFSLISLFEFAFVKIIEWIPFWSNIRLMVIFWLVMPQFDGACHAYQSLVRPVLFVNLEAVIDKLYKPKEEKPHKRVTFLDVAEQCIKENGSEALEKLITSKQECKESENSPRDIQVLEPEENNAAATSKQLKVPDAAQLDNEMLEATKKSAATEVKRVQYAQSKTAAWVPKGTGAAAKVKETTPSEASAENRLPETPPLKKPQQEWTCDLCKVTTTSEKTLNAHLQGSEHKSKCESLKASKLQAKDTGPFPSATGKTNQGRAKPKQDGGANQIFKFYCNQECKESDNCQRDIQVLEPEENNATATSKRQECKESDNYPRDIQVLEPEENNATATSKRLKVPDAAQLDNETLEATKKSAETDAKRVQYAQSKTAAWVPKGTGGAAKVKETTPSEASAENRRPETPPLEKPQQEWTCDLCKVTTTSEKTLNAHLQGSEHKSKCESLKASKLQEKDTGPSPSATGKTNQGKAKPKQDVGANQIFKLYCNVCDQECKESDNYPRDIQVLEPEENNATATSKRLKVPDAAQLDNEMLEATKKSAETDAKRVQYAQSKTTAWVPKGTGAAAKVKGTTPSEASAENRRPETPPLEKPQQEWTCDLCKVTTTSEKTLNAHLQGSEHKSKCESLKASKLKAKDTGPSPSATGKTNQGRAKPKQVGGANQIVKLYCNVCDVKLLTGIDLASHLKGKRHLSNI